MVGTRKTRSTATRESTRRLIGSVFVLAAFATACTGQQETGPPAEIATPSSEEPTSSLGADQDDSTVASVSSSSTTDPGAASADSINSAVDAAAAACADGTVTLDSRDTYVEILEGLGIVPNSALARSALMIECDLSDEEVLDLLP